LETGDFELDRVTFPAAELQLEFMNPAEEGDGDSMFPTGTWWTTWKCPVWAPSRSR
jgi:2-methylaconitate cis-trans-isomerase PrpF